MYRASLWSGKEYLRTIGLRTAADRSSPEPGSLVRRSSRWTGAEYDEPSREHGKLPQGNRQNQG